jgi:Ethanolamine ammonia-lyase, small subunit
MNEREMEQVVAAVLSALAGQPAPGAEPAQTEAGTGRHDAGCLDDIMTPEFKKISCLQHPHNPEALRKLQETTGTRMGLGKAGARPGTAAYLRFLADHARSKGTVFKNVPEEWLARHGLFAVQSLVADKDQYLTRPDLGRRLSPETLSELKRRYPQPSQVQVVLSDGLSTDAMLSNYEEILPVLTQGFKALGISSAEPFFLRFGRVKAEDAIGEALQCDVVVLLIGERPGLGQSESMSCYAVYRPTAQTTESQRTVISNIHAGGIPPVEAGAVIVELVADMLKHKASGIDLNKLLGAA